MTSCDVEQARAMVHPGVRWNPGTSQWEQPESTHLPGTKRGRVLKRMCVVAFITLIVLVISIAVGAYGRSISGTIYLYCLRVYGMGFLVAGCMFCLYYAAEKRVPVEREELTAEFMCCFLPVVVLLVFTFTGTLFVLIIFPLRELSECYDAKEDIGYLPVNRCIDNAETKYSIAALTVALLVTVELLLISPFGKYLCNIRSFRCITVDDPNNDNRSISVRHYTVQTMGSAENTMESDENSRRQVQVLPCRRQDEIRDSHIDHVNYLEAPPPSYDEVVEKYTKANEVL